MTQRNASELWAGAVVLIVAAGFLGYAIAHTGRSSVSGYRLHASFDRIDGVSVGSDVRLAGISVGRVTEARINPHNFQAELTFVVQDPIKLPKDTSAEITSDGLLGGKVLSLVPGGDSALLPDDGVVTITQSAVSLEELLGKFIFNVGDLASNVQKQLQQQQSAPASKSGDTAPAPLK